MRMFFKIIIFIVIFIATNILMLNDINLARGLNKIKNKERILIFNSYHEGYKWSDDIVQGIKSKLEEYDEEFEISLEYMDTKRVNDEKYLSNLYELYKNKFTKEKYDLIITCDEAAYQFMIHSKNEIFPQTPVVFCGVNYFENDQIKNITNITGVVESYYVEETLQTALEINKSVNKVYIISDNTLTGQAVRRSIDKAKNKLYSKLEFFNYYNKDVEELKELVANLPEDSIILYLFYFQDTKGVKYNYDEVIKTLSNVSKVPIYTIWGFNLGNGALGGKVTNGFSQGYKAGELAYRILQGENAEDIKVVEAYEDYLIFDFKEMEKHNISKASLPQNSLVINEVFKDKKNILILNSYHHGMKWVDDIERGILSVLSTQEYSYMFDYMDTKYNSDLEYNKEISDILRNKYKYRKFDLVLTTDDDALVFAKKYGKEVFENTPIVFCGVNYFNESSLSGFNNISGVVESVDVKSTIDLALKQNPALKNILVINDSTVTGKANKKLVEELAIEYERRVKFSYTKEYTMDELLQYIRKLEKDTCILLMTFNSDKANNVFDYYTSGKLISSSAPVPVYVLWDFYLGSGVLGGMVTGGEEQGIIAGNIGKRILLGEDVNLIKPILKSPHRYIFDYNVMNRFKIDTSTIAEDSIVINKTDPFYAIHRVEVIILLVSTILILLVIYISKLQILKGKRNEEQLELLASTDQMTGVYNRRKGISILEKEIKNSMISGEYVSICFIDVDNLKMINDNFGHDEGDRLIQNICKILNESVREKDSIVRLGGDEFLIIMPQSNSLLKEQLIKKFEDNISNNNSKKRLYDISFSYGFSDLSGENNMNIDELIKKADCEMYFQKQRKKKCKE